LASHRVLTPLFGLLIALPLTAFAFNAWPDGDGDTPDSGDVATPPPPVSTASAILFMRAGLDAKDLAAAGVLSSEVSRLAGDALALIDADPSAMNAADLAYEAARSSHDALARKVRSGLASTEEVSQCQALRTQSDDTKSAREALLTSYFDAAAATLQSSARTTLETIRANAAWDLPEEFLVQTRTDQEWLTLREALATERIAQNYQEDFPDEVQTFLAAERADPAVAQAISNIASNYAAVQTAWNSALSE